MTTTATTSTQPPTRSGLAPHEVTVSTIAKSHSETAPARPGVRRVRRLAVAALAVVGFGLATATSASAAAVNVIYPSSSYCMDITTAESGTWQQQLEGSLPQTVYEDLFNAAPTSLSYVAGTAKLVYAFRLAYLATNGSWYYTNNPIQVAVATRANLSGGRFQDIDWNGSSTGATFASGVTPNIRYLVYGTTQWQNSNGQVIAQTSGYAPNYNC